MIIIETVRCVSMVITAQRPLTLPTVRDIGRRQPEVSEPPLELEGAMWRYDPSDDPTDAKAAGLDLNKVIELSKLDNDA